MIRKLKFVEASGLKPYRNQAIEKYLLDTCRKDETVLYLWANDKTVFIGKNQNAYTECNLSALARDKGFLARRFTGGGAVYHDKGNLNFTFVSDRENYDISNQFGIITNAMRLMGFDASLSGRNDVLIDGKKFSGNAFYKSETNCLHHGTILINSEYASFSEYLNVSKVKLESKGVKSVASRITNLSEYRNDITVAEVKQALVRSLKNRYPDAEFTVIREEDLPESELNALTEHFSDENYVKGDNIYYDASFVHRFEWGIADIRLSFKGNIIEKVRIYSDALDVESVESKEKLLCGADISKPADHRIKDIIEVIGVKL